MKDDWWFKFEHLKWLTDEQLNRCSLETQGFWIRTICVMRKSGSAKLAGSPAELARVLSVTPAEFKRCVSELDRTKTATVTQTSQNVTLMSRKFHKELKVKEQNRLRQQQKRRHAKEQEKSQPHNKSKSKEKEIRETPKNGAVYVNGQKLLDAKPSALSPTLEKETNILLDAVAPLVGAKSRDTMADLRRWREAAEKAVREQIDVPTFLSIVKSEYTKPQYATPEGVLRQAQSKNQQVGKWDNR